MSQFAVVNSRGIASVVSNTELGAKQYATRNGYSTICQVSPYSMTCYNLKTKQGKKWVNIQGANV
jgi:hypothetical protein